MNEGNRMRKFDIVAGLERFAILRPYTGLECDFCSKVYRNLLDDCEGCITGVHKAGHFTMQMEMAAAAKGWLIDPRGHVCPECQE